jgi:exodeoxyribonuclease VII small subunit
MTKKDKQPSFEDKLKSLEDITRKLDDPSSPLEESLELFEKGVKLGKELHMELEASKLRVKRLLDNGELDSIDSAFTDKSGGSRED